MATTKKAPKVLTEWEQAKADERAATKRVKELEGELKIERARLEGMKAAEATIERVVITPLTEGLEAAKAKLAATEQAAIAHNEKAAANRANLEAELKATREANEAKRATRRAQQEARLAQYDTNPNGIK